MDTYTLTIVDLIEKAGLPLDDLVLVRHALTEEHVRLAWEEGRIFFEEYQKIQPKDYFKGKKYILSFVSAEGKSARFLGVYEVKGQKPISEQKPMNGYPNQKSYSEPDTYYYDLVMRPELSDFRERLRIYWGGGTKNPVHYKKETIEQKYVVAISPEHEFPGYDKLVLRFDELKKIASDKDTYHDYYEALSSVCGVYLVIDDVEGKRYVGSAYGKEGIWGRWNTYASTNGKGGPDENGANKGMEDYLNANPDRYRHLQYSILHVVPKTGYLTQDKHRALEFEKLYKKKLLTDEKKGLGGLNRN